MTKTSPLSAEQLWDEYCDQLEWDPSAQGARWAAAAEACFWKATGEADAHDVKDALALFPTPQESST